MSSKCCPTDKGPAECTYAAEGEALYITGPRESKKGIVVIGDIFGMHHNSLRYVDTLGKAGFLVVMPDLFGSKAWPANAWPPDLESKEWGEFSALSKRFDDYHLPKVRKAVELLRQMGCTRIASIGMCWGSRIAFDLAAENLIDAAATAHPSYLTPEAVTKALGKPMCILLSKDEGPFDDVEAVAKKSSFKISIYCRYKRLPHGFLGARFNVETAVKEDLAELQEATEKTITFFNEALN